MPSANLSAEFGKHGVRLFGLSTQQPEYQRELSERLYLRFPVLSDAARALTDALRLPTLTIGGHVLLARLSWLQRNGRIERVWYPVFPPIGTRPRCWRRSRSEAEVQSVPVTATARVDAVPDRAAAGYLVAQAVVVLLWWGTVLFSQTVRTWFFPYGGLDPAFVAFLLPDLVFIVGGSLFVARRKLRGDAAPRASGILLGAVGYGTLYTIGWTLLLQAPAASVVAVVVMSVGTFRACR